MINRILIRIKVVQTMYSYLVSGGGMTLSEAQKELSDSLDKGYELYNRLLLLPVELTRLHERRIDNAKHKYLPTEEDLNPNMKLVGNLFVKALVEDSAFSKYVEKNHLSWEEQDVYLRLELERILGSELYAAYIGNDERTWVEDCRLWHDVLREIVFRDEELDDALEGQSVYWNDDLSTIGSFVLKTIKLFEQHDQRPVLPQFKDEEDSRFGSELLNYTVADMEQCNALIDRYVRTEQWDTERIALMDRLVMCVAIAELLHYPAIPASVTMNEYIEIAKFYSTPKSGQYVNGILNSVVNYMRGAGMIKK